MDDQGPCRRSDPGAGHGARRQAPTEGNWNGVYGTAFVGALLQQSEYFEDYYNNTFNNDGWGGLAGVGVGVNFQQGQSVFGIEPASQL